MPAHCCIADCKSYCDEATRSSGITLLRIPVERRRRRAWLKAMGRKKWEPRPWHRICTRHFVDGWASVCPEDINYRPTLFLAKECPAPPVTPMEQVSQVCGQLYVVVVKF